MTLVSKQENENNKNNCNLKFKNDDGEIKEFVLPYEGYLSYLSDLSTANNNIGGKRRTKRRSNKKRTKRKANKKTKTKMKKRKTSKKKTNKRRRKR